MRHALAALACLFLAAHLPFLPPSLEDIDSVNFALGVRDFDVARHQPHPPGYPVSIALSKAAASVLGGTDDPRAVVVALAGWSAVAGAALVVLLFGLFRLLEFPVDLPVGVDLPPKGGSHELSHGSDGSHESRAWWAMAIAVACPLFWFTALRPLTDMTGLAAAVASQVLVLGALTRSAGRRDTRPAMLGMLAMGAFAAGVAAGVRAQTVMMTAPLLLTALIAARDMTVRTRLTALLAALAGVALWAVPLLLASGGLGGYLAALGTQAGEDFSGVVMLWTSRSPRAAVAAFTHTFLWPWGGIVPGAIVFTAALIGLLRLLRSRPRTILWLAIAFGPYAVFHLLFHETATIRYALPLVLPVAFLVSAALDWAGRRPAMVLSTLLVAVTLSMGARAARAYGSNEAPAFQAMRDAGHTGGALPVAMHAVFRRTAEWSPPPATVLGAAHGREWLTLVERWRAEPETAIAFVADPRRTDLALFDPRARELQRAYRWTFPELPYVGGVRPGDTDRYVMRPPGWMLDRGWALSAEIGGVAAREGTGPHVAPSVAWARARPDASLLMIGGRNLDGGSSSQLTLSRGPAVPAVVDRWDAPPGFFFRLVTLPAGALDGRGYVPLSVRAGSAGPPVRVSLEQFDLQPDGVAMVGFTEGWYEPEYNPVTARSWRWSSERAVLWVRPIGRDVTLTLAGESPLRYFDAPPSVRVSAGGQELTRFSPATDFTHEVRLPAPLLDAGGGRVVVESDRWFVPAERGESADPRHLALRIYQVGVR